MTPKEARQARGRLRQQMGDRKRLRREAVEALSIAARALAAAVTFDDSGVHGRGGNGGLFSRETIRKNDEMKLALSRFDATHPA